MHNALSYLARLPDKTIVYNGHEYTNSSLKFALSVDPENAGLKRLQGIVKENQVTTGLTTIGDEKEWNPFMRLASDPVREATKAAHDATAATVMDTLRNLKNNFRG